MNSDIHRLRILIRLIEWKRHEQQLAAEERAADEWNKLRTRMTLLHATSSGAPTTDSKRQLSV